MNTKKNDSFEYKLDVYQFSVELARGLRPLMEKLRGCDADLARQMRRALTSVPLNINEGTGRTGRDRLQHFKIALGSAREVQACLDVAEALGYAEPDERALHRLDRICGMLWRLSR